MGPQARSRKPRPRGNVHGQRDRIIELEPGEWHQIEDQNADGERKAGGTISPTAAQCSF
jgi:hypothetical protein